MFSFQKKTKQKNKTKTKQNKNKNIISSQPGIASIPLRHVLLGMLLPSFL